nr:hypothetical protein [Lacticaseibacillus camelliae]
MRLLPNISIRRFAKADLTQFAEWVRPQLPASALNLAVITDTHDRTAFSRTYYGPTATGTCRSSTGWPASCR